MDEGLKIMNENQPIVHDVVKHFNDLVNGIKEAISEIESQKDMIMQSEDSEGQSQIGTKKVKVRNMTKMVQDNFIKQMTIGRNKRLNLELNIHYMSLD